jgi:hypothetical protein
LPAFLESQFGVDPGFVHIECAIASRFEFFYLYQVFCKPINNIGLLNGEKSLVYLSLPYKTIPFQSLFKDVPLLLRSIFSFKSGISLGTGVMNFFEHRIPV